MFNRAEKIANLIRRARNGEKLFGVQITMHSPASIELLGATGVADYVCLDAHHSGATWETIANSIRTCELWGLPAFVRLNDKSPAQARTALDLGACGAWLPNIETADEVRAVLRYCKFPPAGVRGCCTMPRVNNAGSEGVTELFTKCQIVEADQNPSQLIMPELYSDVALENIDEILSIPECPIIVSTQIAMSLYAGINYFSPDGFAESLKMMSVISKRVHDAGKLLVGMAFGWAWTPESGQLAAEIADKVQTDFFNIPELLALHTGYKTVNHFRAATEALREKKSAAKKLAAAAANEVEVISAAAGLTPGRCS